MNQPLIAIDRAEGVRGKTLALLANMADDGKAMALPEPPPGMAQVRRKLEDNTYQVLVVGEAKRGKSTLVNALIGRAILPTDVDIATSQVFRICPSEREAYRLRFEDDSEREITAADLPRYGSQVVADQCGVPRLDQTIRWIEIDLPVKFLPANVRILDTPGLGALYAAHAEITHRFVPHADAVIFVLESQAPIGDPEIRFVEQLLSVTPNIFFVQTKIDQFRKEAWQEVQRRNHSILQQRFAGKLGDGRVWPMSSTNLAKVAATNDQDYLQVSRYKELEAALHGFLFRVAGWDRAAIAAALAHDYHAQARAALARRLASLDADPAARPDAGQWASRRQQFAKDWAESGDNYQNLRGDIRTAANKAKRAFAHILQPNSMLEVEQRTKIDRLKSAKQAQEHARQISDDILAAVSERWRYATDEFRGACAAAFAPFWQTSRMLDGRPRATDPTVAVQSGATLGLGGSNYQRTKAAMHEFTVGSAVASATVITLIGPPAAIVALCPPVAVVGIVLGILGVGIWGAQRAWRGAAAQELREGQQELHKHLTTVLLQARQQFLGTDAGAHHDNPVDDYFRARLRDLDRQITEMVRVTLAEMNAEAARFEENAKLDGDRRAAKAEETQRQLQHWDTLAERLKEIQAELQELERA
jgi:GTPase SAR1 family protein